MEYKKEQIEKIKELDRKYTKWIKINEEHQIAGRDLLTQLKAAVGATNANYEAIKDDINRVYADEYRKIEL